MWRHNFRRFLSRSLRLGLANEMSSEALNPTCRGSSRWMPKSMTVRSAFIPVVSLKRNNFMMDPAPLDTVAKPSRLGQRCSWLVAAFPKPYA